MNEETVICSCCGEIIRREDNAGNEDTPLCQDCYDRHYTTCSDCGRLISCSDSYYADDNEDDPLCYDCYQRCRSHRAIHVAGTQWGNKKYMNMRHLEAVADDADIAG